jgi:hypothetical protein
MCLWRGKSGERVLHSLRRLRYSQSLRGRDREGDYFEHGAARLARGRTKGTLTSWVYDSAHKDTFIPSWNARTPSGTRLRMEMRVRSGGS